ncbi:MAG: tetratricopeptide repeat-containing sensor histidine kinase [Chitinophagaceae bacterium]
MSKLISCTTSTIDKKKQIQKEFDDGEKYVKEVTSLFNAGRLNEVATTFSEVCKKNNLTPIMKLSGFSVVYNSFIRKETHDSAIQYLDSCIDIIEKKQLEKILPGQYISYLLYKSASLYRLHRPNEANVIFYKVKKMNDVNDDVSNRTMIAEQLAFISYRQKNYKEALESFREVWSLHNKLLPDNFYAETEKIGNIGLCFFHLKKYDSALYFYQKAITILDLHKEKLAPYINTKEGNQIVYEHAKGVVLGNIANVYVNLKKWDSVIVYSKPSIAYNRGMSGERRDAQVVSSRLIDAYIELKKWDDAITLLQQVEKSLDSLPDEKVRMQWNLQMATYLEKQNKPSDAFSYFKVYNHIRDSLQKIELADAESDLIKDLKIKNQDNDLLLLKKDNQLSKVYIWITLGLIILSVLIIFFVLLNYKKTKKNNKKLSLLNEEINTQKNALTQSNKDKDRILRVVAHDLRNPLSGIAAVSKTILETDEDMQSKKLVEMIEKTSNHSLQLINELLQTHTQVDVQFELQNTNLNDVISNVYTLVKHKAEEKNQSLNLNISNATTIVNIDVAKMERVFSNLINNAIKFTDIGGVIEINVIQHQSNAQVSVKDNGIGIASADQENIFEMFGQSRKKGTAGEKSFGMGLSICKQIVDAHQGKIWVESEEGNGTCFYVELPIHS